MTQTLDAFGYWPTFRSRVRGLGGAETPTDPNYVFHSNYADIAPGGAFAEVTFRGLRARQGMIAIRVFQYLPEGTPQVTEVARTTALLPSLGKSGRPIILPFTAIAGAQYALNGHVFGDCEARAEGVDVAVGARPNESDDPWRARSMIGRLKARRAVGLASVETPLLSWPVSQGLTADQLREPDFARLGGATDGTAAATRWETAYIMRVLESYGRLDPAARGLALAMARDDAAAQAQAAGCDVTAVTLAPGETIAQACARTFADPVAGKGFDFLWTRADVFGAGGAARALGLIDETLERLRPGGLAIHIVTVDGEMNDNALDRIALGLNAAGHIVAQMRHARADRPPTPFPFGIVVRKATEPTYA